jgi:hypothetical protein
MTPVLLIALKVVLAGLAVAVFSLISTATRPKMFSGLFAGAPVVAAVSLLITGLIDRPSAVKGAGSMVSGAVGMFACCTVTGILLPRLHAIPATAVGWLAWAAATALALLVLPL